MRTLAIGDIHGCSTALDALLELVKPKPGDRIVTVGDYVDRGPDSRGVLERLIRLHVAGQLVPLRGNHEIMMLGAREGRDNLRFWLGCGGAEALESYAKPGQQAIPEDIPAVHWHFIQHSCVDWFEGEKHFFVHANAYPDLPLEDQPSSMLHWEFLEREKGRRMHESGKIMVCGHSEQRSGLPLNLGAAVCIDTWAYGGGWLTCLDVDTGEYWQANQKGETRTGWLDEV